METKKEWGGLATDTTAKVQDYMTRIVERGSWGDQAVACVEN